MCEKGITIISLKDELIRNVIKFYFNMKQIRYILHTLSNFDNSFTK